VFQIKMWGLGNLFGGAKPTKAPMATKLVNKRHLFQRLLPHHAKYITMRATPFLSFACWNDFFYDRKCEYIVEQRGLQRNSTAYRLAL